ncbi:helix-turn-helix domain-containing protein [Spirillospora sp. NPDC052242]
MLIDPSSIEPTHAAARETESRLVGESAHAQVFTVEQIAEILQIGRDKVYMLLRTKQLRSIKIGRLRRITDRQLAEYIAAAEDMP